MSGVSTATRSASFTASAGSATAQAVGLRLVPARAALAHADHDVEAGVMQVERMGAALAAVAEDGDAVAFQCVDGCGWSVIARAPVSRDSIE